MFPARRTNWGCFGIPSEKGVQWRCSGLYIVLRYHCLLSTLQGPVTLWHARYRNATDGMGRPCDRASGWSHVSVIETVPSRLLRIASRMQLKCPRVSALKVGAMVRARPHESSWVQLRVAKARRCAAVIMASAGGAEGFTAATGQPTIDGAPSPSSSCPLSDVKLPQINPA